MTLILTHKERKNSPISLLVSFQGKRYVVPTGESTEVALWNQRTHRIRIKATNTDDSLINDRLELWEKAAEKTVALFKERQRVPETDEFTTELRSFRFGNTPRDTTLVVPYFDTFLARYQGARSSSALKHYASTKNTLIEYEKYIGRKLRFHDINMDFYNGFKAWFFLQGFSTNYFADKIKILKTVIKDARELDGIDVGYGFEARGFVATNADADTIYLSEEELELIRKVHITPEAVASLPKVDDRKMNLKRKTKAMLHARDLFLIGAYTGLRFQDYSTLTAEDFSGAYIVNRNRKTGTRVVIPIHPTIRTIVQSGYDFTYRMSQQKFNEHIKEVAHLAGITELIHYSRSVGGKRKYFTDEKWKLVTSHTARRSFATNAYKSGIPAISVMKITGHRRESNFMKYIRISGEENAAILADTAFFSGVQKGVQNEGTKPPIPSPGEEGDTK